MIREEKKQTSILEKKSGNSIILTLIFLISLAPALSIQISLSDQGEEVKYNGQTIPLGNLTVQIWDAISAGNLLYEENFTNRIINGSWAIMLGDNGNLELAYGIKYYKDYKVNGNNLNFTNNTGGIIDRLAFYSPLGAVNATFITGTLQGDGTGGWTNNSENTTTILNVGIGTTSPQKSLDVSKNFVVGDGIRILDSDSGYFQFTQSTGIAGAFQPIFEGYATGDSMSSLVFKGLQTAGAASANGVIRMIVRNSTDNGIIPSDNISFRFDNNNDPALVILGNGRVGIATIYPLFTFHVNGSVNATNVSADNFYGKINASYIQSAPWLTESQLDSVNQTAKDANTTAYAAQLRINSINATQIADNITLTAAINTKLTATDQRFNETSLINGKLEVTDQRYNETALIASKLEVTDQRFNETGWMQSINATHSSDNITLSALISLKLSVTDQRFNETSLIAGKLDNSDQRFNETALIAGKLDVTDQRFNETGMINSINITQIADNITLTAAINTKLTETDQRFNETSLISGKLDDSDQRFNDTARLNSVNTTVNILSLGFNTTAQLDDLYYAITNPNAYITNAISVLTNFFNKTDSDLRYLLQSDQRFNETSLIDGKLEVTDQRYNETALIASKLEVTDQRFNETGWMQSINATHSSDNITLSALISLKLSVTDQRFNDSLLVIGKLDDDDQRFNDTARLNSVNTTVNILSLGFNTTAQLDDLYYAITNPNAYITNAISVLTNFFNKTDSDLRYLLQSDQRFNETSLIDGKLEVTDQRYNETALIASKLEVTDQRFNETGMINSINITQIADNITLTAAINTKLTEADQRFNETSALNLVSSNSGGWTNTSENTTTMMNVGIGTDSPSTALDVAGNVSLNTTLYVNNGKVGINGATPYVDLHIMKNPSDENAIFAMTSGVSMVSAIYMSQSDSPVNYNKGGFGIIYDGSTNLFSIKRGGAGNLIENITLSIERETGDVGIGVEFPAERLHIKGSLRVDNLSDEGAFYINGTSGNVGIGTIYPDTQLHLHKNSGNLNQYITTNSSGTPALWLATNYSLVPNWGGIGIDNTDHKLKISTTGSFSNSSMTFDRSGKVGIGTTSPESTLHISGNETIEFLDKYGPSRWDSPGLIFRRARGNATNPLALIENDSMAWVGVRGFTGTAFAQQSSGGIEFASEENWTDAARGTYLAIWTVANGTNVSSEKMRLTSTGKLGIGTTTPSAKLDVTGSARFESNITLADGHFMINSTVIAGCSASNEGAIMYNYSLKKHIGCNSTDWNELY